jgi:hypothetical protein
MEANELKEFLRENMNAQKELFDAKLKPISDSLNAIITSIKDLSNQAQANRKDIDEIKTWKLGLIEEHRDRGEDFSEHCKLVDHYSDRIVIVEAKQTKISELISELEADTSYWRWIQKNPKTALLIALSLIIMWLATEGDFFVNIVQKLTKK